MSYIEDKELEEIFINEKPFLRFRVGNVVFFKTDSKRKNPMCIYKIIDPFGCITGDYVVTYFDSFKTLHYENVFDVALVSDE